MTDCFNNLDWFNNLDKTQQKYIEDHPDPSHMVYYLKKHISFNDALKMGYQDYVSEDQKLNYNTSITEVNTKYNVKK